MSLVASAVGVTIKKATLLDDVSLQATNGQWISIIGPNGAGKSTLLRVLAGVLEHSGTVTIAGKDVASLSPRERSKLVSWVPQTPTIPQGISVLDYVLLGRTPHLHPLASPKRADVDLAHDMLGQLDLDDFAGRHVDTLSGGELQRVAIGRALVQEAPIILLDEPTSALDLGHQQDVLYLLDSLREQGDRTIVSTMHDLTLAGQFADELVLLANGTVAARGSAADVLTADNIEQHYRAAVTVTTVDDAVMVVPRIDRNSKPTNPTNPTEDSPT